MVAALIAPTLVAQDISFDPSITQGEFEQFSRVLGQAFYPSPVAPAGAAGVLGLDIGIALTAIEVDETAPYWQLSVTEDILQDGYLPAPRLVVLKGLGRFNLSGSYFQIPDSDVAVIGATLDLTLSQDGIIRPAVGIRGAWSEVRGVDDLDMRVTGIEVIASKKFGPLTPWIAYGREMFDATGRIRLPIPEQELLLTSEIEDDRISAGVRVSLLLIELAAEAVRHDDVTTWGARVSLSL